MDDVKFEDCLNPEKSLDERIEIIDKLISETKENLEHYSELVYPREHEFYRQRLHSYELTRTELIIALGEPEIKRHEE